MNNTTKILISAAVITTIIVFAYKNNKKKLTEVDKLALFNSTIRQQYGQYPGKEFIERQENAIKASKEKIKSLGLDQEYNIWLDNYNKQQEDMPLPQ